MIFKYLKYINVGILIIYICHKKKLFFSKEIVLMILYYVSLIVSSFFNKNDYMDLINTSLITIFGCYILFELLRVDLKNALNAFLIILEIYVYINFITLIIWPNGLLEAQTEYPKWFLGIDNLHIVYILPAIVVSYIYSYLNSKEKKISVRSKIFTLVCVVSLILRMSITSIIGITAFIVVNVLLNLIKERKIINFYSVYVFMIGLYLAVVMFRLQNVFAFLITDILGKDLTFTGRTYVWDYVIKSIMRKPLFGYGNVKLIENIYFNNWVHNFSHPHNLMLNILFKGGIFSFGIFTSILINLAQRMKKFSNEKVYNVVLSFIFTFLLMSLTEVFNLEYFFAILVIIGVLCLKEKANEENISNCTDV